MRSRPAKASRTPSASSANSATGGRRHVARRSRLARRASRRARRRARAVSASADGSRDLRRSRRGGPNPLRDGLDTPGSRRHRARPPFLPRVGAGAHRHRELARRRPLTHRIAAAETVDGNPERAAQIASAAERLAREDGIVVVYSDETPGRELVEQGRAALSAAELARATEIGQQLTMPEILELARNEARTPA